MIGLLFLSLAQAQVPPITTQPVPEPRLRSRPRYDVECELRDLDFGQSYRIALSQYGGVYTPVNGLAARSQTYVRFSRDDLGIFNNEELDLTGSRITEWYSDGPIELVAKNGAGSLTINKTTERQAWFESPTRIAVTVKGGRPVRSDQPERAWEEFMLVGICHVAWESQESAAASPQPRVN